MYNCSRTDQLAASRFLSLRDVVAPVFRHRRLGLLSFLLIFACVISFVLIPSKQYEAEMKIFVNRERVNPLVTTEAQAYITSPSEVSEKEINSEVELIKSRDLLEGVVLTCNLPRSGTKSFWTALFPTAHAIGREVELQDSRGIAEAVRRLGKNLQVEPLKKTSLISLKYKSTDPKVAALVLNTLANLYLEKHVTVHRPRGTFDFFQGQTKRFKDELTGAETNLANFDREQGVVSARIENEMTLQKLNEFDATLQTLRAGIAETKARIGQLGGQLAAATPRMATQVRTSDNPYLLSQLQSTILNLSLKRTELLRRFAPDYPLVEEIEKEIMQAREAAERANRSPVRDETTDRDPTYDASRAELSRSRTEIVALQARERATAQIVNRYRDRVTEIDQKGVAQQALMRTAKQAEDNYQLYLRKQEEARISDALDRQRIVNVAVAEAATVPPLSSRPNGLLILLMAGLSAVFGSVALTFATDYFRRSFSTPDDLQSFLNIPVVAAIPKQGA